MTDHWLRDDGMFVGFLLIPCRSNDGRMFGQWYDGFFLCNPPHERPLKMPWELWGGVA